MTRSLLLSLSRGNCAYVSFVPSLQKCRPSIGSTKSSFGCSSGFWCKSGLTFEHVLNLHTVRFSLLLSGDYGCCPLSHQLWISYLYYQLIQQLCLEQRMGLQDTGWALTFSQAKRGLLYMSKMHLSTALPLRDRRCKV